MTGVGELTHKEGRGFKHGWGDEWRLGTGCTLRDTELKNGASRIVFCSHFLGATHINLIC